MTEATPIVQASPKIPAIPSIKSLFQESWEALKIAFGKVFVLSLLGSVLEILLMIVLFIGVAGMGFLAAVQTDSADQTEMANKLAEMLTPTLLMQLGGVFLVVLLVSCVITAVVNLGIVIAVGKRAEKPSLMACLKGGLSALFPVLIVTFCAGLINLGSWYLFLIPGLLVSLFFSFITYEMVLGGKKWFNAITGSVQIWSQHFGEILIRMIVYALAVYGAFYLPMYILRMIISSAMENAPGEATAALMMLSIIEFILSLGVGFYGLVYGVVTYQHAKRVTDATIKPSMIWIWITSILGWVIAILMTILIGVQLSNLVKSPEFQEKFNMMGQDIKAEIESAQESTPTDEMSDQEKVKAWQAAIKPEAQPYWEKSNELFKEMRAAQTEDEYSTPVIKKLNDENIATLKKAVAIDDQNPEIWFNLSNAYTWISSKSGTGKEALEASQKAEELDPTIWAYALNTGELLVAMERYDEAILKLQEVIRAENEVGRAHLSLGVAYKRTGLKDSAKIEIQKGIDILTKYNDDGEFDATILQAQKELQTIK